MEALRLSRAWSLTMTTRTADDGGSCILNLASRVKTSLQIATLCRGRRGGERILTANRKDYNGVFVGFARAQLEVVQGSLFQQQPHSQRNGWRCGSNDKSRSSAVAVVFDDDVEIHRKELLTRLWDEEFEVEINRETDDEAADEEDDENTEEGQDNDFTRHRAAARETLNTALGREEDYEPEKTYWYMRLAVNVRRMLTPRTKGIFLLNILTFLYGSNISIIKSAGETMDPTLFSVGRFAIASLVFTPFLSHALTNKNLRNASVELGLLASAGYLTQCISVLTSDASRVSFISTFTVIVVPLLAGLSGANISKITWIAAATSLTGVGILESNGTSIAIGDVWSFVSAVMFGVHMLRTEHHSAATAEEDSLPVMALQLVVITICSGVWFGASHFNSGDLVINLPTSSWLSIWENAVSLPWLPMFYTGLLSTAFCLWSELVSMRHVKATEAAVIYTTEPLWGAAFAWLTLGERWGPNGWLGAFFILGGSLAMQLFGHPDTPAPNKIVLPPSSLDIVDRGDSFVEKEQPLIKAEERDVGIKVRHPHRLKARKPGRARSKNR